MEMSSQLMQKSTESFRNVHEFPYRKTAMLSKCVNIDNRPPQTNGFRYMCSGASAMKDNGDCYRILDGRVSAYKMCGFRSGSIGNATFSNRSEFTHLHS